MQLTEAEFELLNTISQSGLGMVTVETARQITNRDATRTREVLRSLVARKLLTGVGSTYRVSQFGKGVIAGIQWARQGP